MHFSLLQNAFLLTAECISLYCIWFLKDSAHHIPNQTEIATEEFFPKSLLRKQYEIDFIESHFQIREFPTLPASNGASPINARPYLQPVQKNLQKMIDFASNFMFSNPIYFVAFLTEVINQTFFATKANKETDICFSTVLFCL